MKMKFEFDGSVKDKPSCATCKNYSPKEGPKKDLPKLTKEVFNREDCPKWARYVAVDADGRAFWYKTKPDRLFNEYAPEDYSGELIVKPAKFDASDWEHSLIARFLSTVKKKRNIMYYGHAARDLTSISSEPTFRSSMFLLTW